MDNDAILYTSLNTHLDGCGGHVVNVTTPSLAPEGPPAGANAQSTWSTSDASAPLRVVVVFTTDEGVHDAAAGVIRPQRVRDLREGWGGATGCAAKVRTFLDTVGALSEPPHLLTSVMVEVGLGDSHACFRTPDNSLALAEVQCEVAGVPEEGWGLGKLLVTLFDNGSQGGRSSGGMDTLPIFELKVVAHRGSGSTLASETSASVSASDSASAPAPVEAY
jgi:hypothetical protein